MAERTVRLIHDLVPAGREFDEVTAITMRRQGWRDPDGSVPGSADELGDGIGLEPSGELELSPPLGDGPTTDDAPEGRAGNDDDPENEEAL